MLLTISYKKSNFQLVKRRSFIYDILEKENVEKCILGIYGYHKNNNRSWFYPDTQFFSGFFHQVFIFYYYILYLRYYFYILHCCTHIIKACFSLLLFSFVHPPIY